MQYEPASTSLNPMLAPRPRTKGLVPVSQIRLLVKRLEVPEELGQLAAVGRVFRVAGEARVFVRGAVVRVEGCNEEGVEAAAGGGGVV